jgi:serine phosphatase RsbU (regulator of sigma subunit)
LEYHFKSLRMKEAIHDKLGISVSYVNIGNVFDQENKFNESRAYQKKALTLKIELNDKEGEAIVYNNMALSYGAQKKYVDALAYHLKSLKLREEIQDLQGVSMSYSNIGMTYLAQDKTDEALPYFIKALKLSRELGDKVGEISARIGAGNCYEKKKSFEKAIDFYTQGLTLSKESNYKLGIRDAYFNLASVNEKMNNYSAALSYNKLFSDVKDTLLNEASLKQASELNTQYETDKKEKEILLLTKDQQLKDKTLKEQRLVRIGLIIGLGLFLALSFLLFNRYRFKQKANLILEKQKQEIHQKNTMITDSIDYAKTIQEAILPDDEKLTGFFPEYFILYKPKAIVSGDFYWIGKKDDKIICAVADCTGHGVPGAFMSLLGHNILENVVQRESSVDPGTILTALNEEIVTRFSKGKERETVKHGMDIAIISIDAANHQLQYAGARNSVYIVSGKVLTEIKADKMSTGIVGKGQVNIEYTMHNKTFQKGDMIYLFSDGYPDQKGGPDKRKFYYQPFKDLLLSIHDRSVEKQKQQLNETILNWIGDGEQIDDILVMGIRCS